jgi:glycosyltransferase involved in cell wall biosynthesis
VDEYKKSGVFVYSTHFGEINCISAIKAQAYGCEPVVVNYAALQETVQFGKKIDGDIYDEETQEEFKKALIDTLLKPCGDKKRLEMQKWAQDIYGWEKIAKSWDAEFRKE